jgi:hypothetical protein
MKGRQHDDLARQPGRTPLRGGAPGALRMAEVKERGAQAERRQHQREQAALAVEGVRIRLRQQFEGGIGLCREQGEEQTLGGADQGGKKR